MSVPPLTPARQRMLPAPWLPPVLPGPAPASAPAQPRVAPEGNRHSGSAQAAVAVLAALPGAHEALLLAMAELNRQFIAQQQAAAVRILPFRDG